MMRAENGAAGGAEARDGSTAVPTADGLDYYLAPSPDTIDECSEYRFWPEERVLIDAYFEKGAPVLDLACGLARTTLRLHEAGFPVIGMDLSEGLILAARRRFPYLDLRVGSLTDTGLQSASFQSILISSQAIDMLSTVTQRVQALQELGRLLRPGGVLVYSSHNSKCLHLFSPRHWRRPIWKLRHAHLAFVDFAPIIAEGIHGIYAAPNAVIVQTEELGFRFLEARGTSLSSNQLYNSIFSMRIHYAFRRV